MSKSYKKTTRGLLRKTNSFFDPVANEVLNESKFEKGDKNFHKFWIFNAIPFFNESSSSISKTLFMHLAYEMDKHNKINKTIEDISEELQFSVRSLKSSISELKRFDILRKVNNSLYMVNPDVIYAGNGNKRLVALREYDSLEISRELQEEIEREKTILSNMEKLEVMNEIEKKELVETLINSPFGRRTLAELMLKQEL